MKTMTNKILIVATLLLSYHVQAQMAVTGPELQMLVQQNQELIKANQKLLEVNQKNQDLLQQLDDKAREELEAKKKKPNKLLTKANMDRIKEIISEIADAGRDFAVAYETIKEVEEEEDKKKKLKEIFNQVKEMIKSSISVGTQVVAIIDLVGEVAPTSERQQAIEQSLNQLKEQKLSLEKMTLQVELMNKKRANKKALFESSEDV
ncbi:MAG: hypothetical protein ACK5MD_10575 [Flavobacteriales bacterium]